MLSFRASQDTVTIAIFRQLVSGIGMKVRSVILLKIAQAKIAHTARTKYLSGPRPRRLMPITGDLRRSIKTPVPKITPLGVEAEVRVESRYARLHEEGGKVYPKTAAYLRIPLRQDLRGKLTPANAFVVRSSNGNLLIARKEGDGIEPLYMLVPSVTIEARPFLEPALEDNKAFIMALTSSNFTLNVLNALRGR